METLVSDLEWLELAATSGLTVRPLQERPLQELKSAKAAILRARDAPARIRAWRSVGVSIGVVIVVSEDDEPPEDRARLEPVVLMRRTDRDGLKEALERLQIGEAKTQVRLATGTADFHRALFTCADGSTAKLTGLEVRLLAYLAARSFRVVGREELKEQVWGYRADLDTKTVEMTVARLRKKIRQDSVLTVRGEGYRAVVAPPQEGDPDQALLFSLRRSAILMLQHGQPSEAEQMLQLHARTRKPSDRAEEAEAELIWSRLHFGRGDLDAAVSTARRAREIGRAIGSASIEASAGCALTGPLRLLGRAAEGIAAIEDSLRLFSSLDDDMGRCRALALRADFEVGEAADRLVEAALEAWQQGRTQFDGGITGQPLHAALLMRVAMARRLSGALSESRALYARAADIYELLGNDVARAQALLGVASIDFDHGQDDACKAAIAVALGALQHKSARRVRAQAEAFAAMVEIVTGASEQGLRRVQGAVELLGAGTGTVESAQIDIVLAAALLANGAPDQARSTLGALKIPSGIQSPIAHVAGWLSVALADSVPARRAAIEALPAPARYAETRFTDWAKARVRAAG